MTNLLCSLSVILLTNSVVHWPQKQVPRPSSAIPVGDYIQVTNFAWWGGVLGMMVDDTNADTRTIETTVTRIKLLSVDWPWEPFTATNTTIAWHYSVEERLVRTNGLISWPTDWFVQADVNPIRDAVSKNIDLHIYRIDEGERRVYASYPTNYWLPVAKGGK